ncbi:MAG TPA: hypothetical protein VFF73_37250, partial [Planctomycetota bacterium]|nr:hypothetical protein [Planctomycetota bacterium]
AFDMLFGQPDLAEVDVYDPGTDTWTTLPPLGTARHDMGLVAFNNEIWALSGVETTHTGGAQYLHTDLYTTSPGSWASGPALASPISDTSAVVNAQVFVADPSLTTLSATLYSSASTSTPFAVAGTYPFGSQSRMVGMGGRLFVVGGIDPTKQNDTVTTVQSLDATVSPLPTTLYQHTGLNQSRCRSAIASWNNRIYVFGGDTSVPLATPFGMSTGYQSIASVEAYTP